MMEWNDGKQRCRWVNPKNLLYVRYHDEEWGVPVREDQKLFEMLFLECFQAGLSWECVLNKRKAFAEAFDQFDPERISAYDETKQKQLQRNPKLIRHTQKIRAAITNAAIFLEIQKEYDSFSNYIWKWTDGQVIWEQGKTCSQLSDTISKDLKKRGMRFVGSITIYSYLQAIGVINSHEEGCFLAKKRESF